MPLLLLLLLVSLAVEEREFEACDVDGPLAFDSLTGDHGNVSRLWCLFGPMNEDNSIAFVEILKFIMRSQCNG